MKKSLSFILLLILLTVLFSSCAQKSSPTVTTADDLCVILHAGGELDGMRLLNCQEAFYTYYALGYRYFEYDLKLSSDGRLIATHSWEHLSGGYDGMSYADFLALELEGGYTPVNEDWLVTMLTEYPDVTVIVDAKMENTLRDAEVIKRIATLQQIHGIDLSDRIIPEVFSVEMWEAIREETSFNRHLFSRYKEYYDISTVIENFLVEKFIGIALPYDYLDGYYKENIPYLQQKGYRIFMFGINTAEDVIGAIELGADTVYVDNIGILPVREP